MRRGAGAVHKSDRQSTAEAETRGFGTAANANVQCNLWRDNAVAGVHILHAPIIDVLAVTTRFHDGKDNAPGAPYFLVAQCIVDKFDH